MLTKLNSVVFLLEGIASLHKKGIIYVRRRVLKRGYAACFRYYSSALFEFILSQENVPCRVVISHQHRNPQNESQRGSRGLGVMKYRDDMEK